jgi:predicted phosphohydrolase
MKLAWLTDVHLNFLKPNERAAFYQRIAASHCERVVISGDIAEATSFADLLVEMQQALSRSIYFVLGNHDYYHGQVDKVRQTASLLTAQQPGLYWLGCCGAIKLTPNTLLMGQDGWADGRLGSYQASPVNLQDSRLITDLFQQKCLGRNHLLGKMQSLADTDAEKLKCDLLTAVKAKISHVVAVTHVPPFKQNCLYEGKISSDDYLPYFGSKIMGDVLLQVASAHPQIHITVLCGHTHSQSSYQPIANLVVKSGEAKYFYPEVQAVLDI